MGKSNSGGMRSALIAGSTGLIGRQLLQLLLDNPNYGKVIALTRTPLSITHPKLLQVITNYKDLSSIKDQFFVDDVFCCLGTTMAKAGSKEKFREVDFEYPRQLAEVAHAAGAKQFLAVSALGADSHSAVYYNRVKGEMEEAVSSTAFLSIHFFRPSLLLGDRTEKRPGEDFAKAFYKIFWFIIPAKYKAIESDKVAKGMLHYALLQHQGVFQHESRDLRRF